MEQREVKIKRLAMRSMRRGIKEMDLILSAFADRALASLSDAELTVYDQLLSENDHDLYAWINGQKTGPDHYASLLADISKGSHGLTQPK